MATFLIAGLGTFGSEVAKHLFEAGHDIVGIDDDKQVVQELKNILTDAVVGDATDYQTLKEIGLEDVDIAIVSLGNKMEASILCVLHLKELKVNNIIAKAINVDHKKILEALGANEIVFPEKDMAIRVARRIVSPNMIDYLPLTPEYSIVETAPLEEWVGHSLRELNIRKKYEINIIAIKQIVPEKFLAVPDPDYVIKESDALIILGREDSMVKLKIKG
ncbi:MAG: potassium transporter TrkA [Candidatus Fischerbacteria bacterium RBG_13_37_8]|uniref:Potassium transporter TrkA n=1 Tax=Candidatus Fischerbacteria bacterium RBG_13_37_8 TaxID=1817863 RepID=A0A1F5V9Z0_9BACT|nr:MAG: potassium transporter TrkA [Candidatus Fischerbacteria bacterium RBG_13_37_8]